MSEKVRSTLSRPWASVLVVGAAYLLYLSLRLSMGGWDASVFIEAGDHYVNAGETPETIQVDPGSDGYDGQFYYRLALDPLSTEKQRYGTSLDKPAYRQQRILYPLMVRILTLGDPRLVPEGLILVNLLAIILCAYLGGSLLEERAGPMPGLAIAMYPGFLLSLSRDLAEPLAVALVLASLFALRRQKRFLSTSLLALAVLTRETTLLVAVAGVLVWVWDRSRRQEVPEAERVPWHFWLVPAAIWSGWQSVLLFRSGVLPVTSGGNNITTPLRGVIDAWKTVNMQAPTVQLRWLVEVGLVLAVATVALACIRHSAASRIEKLAFCGYVLLIAMLSGVVWIEDWAFLRAASELFLFAFIILLFAKSRLGTWVRVASIGLWLVLAALNIS